MRENRSSHPLPSLLPAGQGHRRRPPVPSPYPALSASESVPRLRLAEQSGGPTEESSTARYYSYLIPHFILLFFHCPELYRSRTKRERSSWSAEMANQAPSRPKLKKLIAA